MFCLSKPDVGILLLLISLSLAMADDTMCCFSLKRQDLNVISDRGKSQSYLALMTLKARMTSLSNLTSCSFSMCSLNLVLSLLL